jgi:hypothetical protein
MNEQLHDSPWANEWIVDQARRHRIDGAIVLTPLGMRPAATGKRFVQRALERAGIPALAISADMVDARHWDARDMRERVPLPRILVNRSDGHLGKGGRSALLPVQVRPVEYTVCNVSSDQRTTRAQRTLPLRLGPQVQALLSRERPRGGRRRTSQNGSRSPDASA